MMKKHFLFMSLMVFTFHQAFSQFEKSNKTIKVRFHKNIEFMGFVYHLGWIGPGLETHNETIEVGDQKILKSEWHAYGFRVYEKHKAYTQSPHLSEIVAIGSNLDYTPIVDLMMLTDDFPVATLNDAITGSTLAMFSSSRDVQEGKAVAENFLAALNAFYREVDFDQYLKNSKAHYEAAKNQVMAVKPDDRFIKKMEAFYQQEFNHYTLVPSLLIPSGMAFGHKDGTADQMDIYNIFGAQDVQQLDKEPAYFGFGDQRRVMELSVHEFGHSFVNPVVNMVPDSLIAATEHMFEKIAQAMHDQGYPHWKTSLYEHFVRAGEVVIARSMGLEKNAKDLENWYINGRSFIYLPVIIEELESYRQGKYKTYEETVMAAMTALNALTLSESD